MDGAIALPTSSAGRLIVGIDIAARVFQVHAAAAGTTGTKASIKKMQREGLVHWAAQLPRASTIAMEACGTSNHWGRVFQSLGHDVRLLPAQHVKPFVRTNKSDKADALAIWEAAQRPNIHVVRVRSADEQVVMLLHRYRTQLVHERIRVTHRLRAAFREFGSLLEGSWGAAVEEAAARLPSSDMPPVAKQVVAELIDRVTTLQEAVERIENHLRAWAQSNDLATRYLAIPGVGPITATAIAATIGDGASFASGRHFSSALGVVPAHVGTGGVTRIGRLSPGGNKYLKALMVTAAFHRMIRRKPGVDPWVDDLVERKKPLVAAVCIANKLGRVMWSMAYHGTTYDPAKWCGGAVRGN